MKRIKRTVNRLLHPSTGVLICIPTVSFAALIVIFACRFQDSIPVYMIYGMSAYSLVVWVIALPQSVKRVKDALMSSKPMQTVAASKFAQRYRGELAFRGCISLYQGAIFDLFYVIFRVVAGIRCNSVWFISTAVYYLVLGVLRTGLIVGYRRRTPIREYRCYRTTAWLLFLLNIPMGGMIVLTVWTNTGFSYPGYIIYLSALYTFYTMITAGIQLVKFRRLGSPILSAAKVLNFVAGMMSILGLQTAMIARFSANGEHYRKMMNAVTGGFVYGIVILIAVYMLLHGRILKKKVETVE